MTQMLSKVAMEKIFEIDMENHLGQRQENCRSRSEENI